MTNTTAEVKTLMSGAMQTFVGTFYCGGSFPRLRYLTRYQDGILDLSSYNTGGSFHGHSVSVETDLIFFDACPADDGQCRDAHAYAAAIRAAVARLS